MVNFEVLGTDQEIDSGDPTGSLLSLLYVVLGAAALFMALPIGRQIGRGINGMLAGALGTGVGDNSPGETFGSAD